MSSVSIDQPSDGTIFTQTEGTINVNGHANENGKNASAVYTRMYASSTGIPHPQGTDPVPQGAIQANVSGVNWSASAVPFAEQSLSGAQNYLVAWAKFSGIWSTQKDQICIVAKLPGPPPGSPPPPSS